VRRLWLWPANLIRGLFLLVFLLVVSIVYGLGRLWLWLAVRDRARRASRVARWKGRVIRRSMTILGATFIKMGQVLSSRPDLLEPEIIAELELLQDRLPAFAFSRARKVIEADLGKPIGELYAEIDEQPVAAASVAQVHRAKLADGTEVAVKVLRPSIRRQVERDSAILMVGARLLALRPKWRLSDPVGHLSHFVAAIIQQTDLTFEADNYERFAQNFAGRTDVVFPAVHRSLCSKRVLTMEFMRGTRFDKRDKIHDKPLAKNIREMMFKMCFDDGFIHADLHPGNFLIRDGTQLIVFDAGMAKLLRDDILIQFIDFSRCLTVGTADDFVAHVRRFHTYVGDTNWDAFRADIVPLIASFRAKTAARLEYSQLFADIFALARKYRARPVVDLTLVMVAMITVQGIGKTLDPENNVFQDVAGYLMPLLAKKGLLAQLVAPAAPAASSAANSAGARSAG
jgi:ubiquinone biosynthesis protein